MKVLEDAYYLVDVSYTKGIVTEGEKEGRRYTANRTLFNIIEQPFRVKADAKRYMEQNGMVPAIERKLAKYKTTASGRMMMEDRKRYGIGSKNEYQMEVDSERVGWAMLRGYDVYFYFAETWGIEK